MSLAPFTAFTATIAAVIFCFGLVVGSFLNVCIVRIPSGKSIVSPPSACPKCGAHIRPYDNIPVISWVVLRGRCRGCQARISPIYPAVELLTALLFLGCYLAFGLTVDALKWAVFSALMIVLVFTDLRERILPDVVNFSGFAAGLVLSFFTAPSDGTATWIANQLFTHPLPRPVLSFADAMLGAALGSGLLWLVSKAYFRMRHREGMGLGDVKMMLLIGAFLGPRLTLLTILAGSLLGSILGLFIIMGLFLGGWKRGVAERASRRGLGTSPQLRCAVAMKYPLPFGTYLGVAAVLAVFFGSPIVQWYQSLLMVR
ncbi:MAG: prepilin peptidase [Acidobacteriota bacterium]|nr:prepilin peptidase [Acidobacteriota bacterium]